MNWLNYILWKNTIQEYLIFLAILIGLFFILKFFKFVVVQRLFTLSRKTKNDVDDLVIDIIKTFGWLFYMALSLTLSIKFISTSNFINKLVFYIFIILTIFYGVKSILKVVDYTKKKIIKQRRKEEPNSDTSLIDLLANISKGIIWVIAFLVVLSNFGFDVTSLIAGLGIGGIAIAFALQGILSDLFASFSIYFDKPFQVGDYIVIGADKGTVKKIGIKSTRIKTLQGEELVVSNKELTSTRINNYKKMEKRRIVFQLGVTYDTKYSKLEKIPNMITDIFKKVKRADLDRVHFKSYGDFSLNYEIVFYVHTKEYKIYMDIQQEVNLAIKKAFDKEKIEFAFPTQTIYLEK